MREKFIVNLSRDKIVCATYNSKKGLLCNRKEFSSIECLNNHLKSDDNLEIYCNMDFFDGEISFNSNDTFYSKYELTALSYYKKYFKNKEGKLLYYDLTNFNNCIIVVDNKLISSSNKKGCLLTGGIIEDLNEWINNLINQYSKIYVTTIKENANLTTLYEAYKRNDLVGKTIFELYLTNLRKNINFMKNFLEPNKFILSMSNFKYKTEFLRLISEELGCVFEDFLVVETKAIDNLLGLIV